MAETARSIAGDSDNVVSLVRETVETVTSLVYSLLGVHNCQHCSGSGRDQQHLTSAAVTHAIIIL